MEIDFVDERIVQALDGQTILDASLRAGIPHYHACGGNGKCSTCRVKIIDGHENLSHINKREAKLRKSINLPDDVRLACQTTVSGSVKVKRLIKDESDIFNHIRIIKKLLQDNRGRRPIGEERHLVLFFLDIRDFTPFVETNLPYDVIDVWRRLFGIFHKAITNHGGQIIDTAGDELYAVFGVRTSLQDGSKAAIEAGMEIIQELKVFNNSTIAMCFAKRFGVGIGIHSGKVIVGETRLGKMKKRSVMGLAVNIASRIQEATKILNNSFVVSEVALDHSTLTITGSQQIVNLRGITSPINVHLIGEPYGLDQASDFLSQDLSLQY
jgi:adenylate cyclase